MKKQEEKEAEQKEKERLKEMEAARKRKEVRTFKKIMIKPFLRLKRRKDWKNLRNKGNLKSLSR